MASIAPAHAPALPYTSDMPSEKEQYMSHIKSCALPIKPPPRGIDLPCEDGESMETDRHRQQMTLLISSLSDAWADRQDFYVGGNMFVYFSELQAKNNDFRGPDFFVVLHTHKLPHRRSWVVWEEGGKSPDLVIELISESTEAEDRGRKMDVYARLLRVPEYYLYDPWDHRLEGYRLDLSRYTYEAMSKDENGRYFSEVLKLGLGVLRSCHEGYDIEWLRFFDKEGHPLPVGLEHGAIEAKRADAEAKRADAEAKRADAEAKRANDALAKLAEYERLLSSRS